MVIAKQAASSKSRSVFFLSPVSSIGHLVSTRPSIVRNTASELEKTLGGSDTLETLFTGAALESTGVPPGSIGASTGFPGVFSNLKPY